MYNKYGHTAVDEIGTRIFASPEEANKMVDHFRRPKPPPSTVNEGLADLPADDANDKFYQQRIKVLTDKIVGKALNSTHSKFQ